MITATLHPVLWIVFWIFAPGFTLCALALIGYAVFGPPTGVELEEKRQQSFLDRMDAAAKENCPVCNGCRKIEAMDQRIVECPYCDENGKFIVSQKFSEPEDEPVCTTCGGLGTIDETLGGHAFSDPEAPCPDCKP